MFELSIFQSHDAFLEMLQSIGTDTRRSDARSFKKYTFLMTLEIRSLVHRK